MRKIGKNIATGLMVTALFAASATTAFAASATINAYGTFGYTSVLTGPRMKLTCTAKANQKGNGSLHLKDPYLWHEWKGVNIGTTGARTKTISSADGSANASWKGYAENSKVTISSY